MRILVHDFGGYSFCFELSRELARRGHSVQHAYFPAASESMRNVEPSVGDPPKLQIVALGGDIAYPKFSLVRRRFSETAFGNRLALHIATERPDVVLSANAPLDVQLRALRAARKANSRFVFWMQDIINAAMSDILPAKFGPLGSAVARYYAGVERKAARQSDAVVCISDAFLPVLDEWGIPEAHRRIIENWAPKDDIRPSFKDNAWSRAHNLHDKKVFLYSGRLGFKHNPELLLELALKCRDDPTSAVLVVAEGQGADWLTERKHVEGLNALTILPFQPYTSFPDVLATGDVLVCVIEPGASRYSAPSKILSYLAAGRAILAAIPENNINAQHILRVGAGAVVDPADTPAFRAAAHELMSNDEKRRECAARARAYAEKAFKISGIADCFMEVLVSPDGFEPSTL